MSEIERLPRADFGGDKDKAFTPPRPEAPKLAHTAENLPEGVDFLVFRDAWGELVYVPIVSHETAFTSSSTESVLGIGVEGIGTTRRGWDKQRQVGFVPYWYRYPRVAELTISDNQHDHDISIGIRGPRDLF